MKIISVDLGGTRIKAAALEDTHLLAETWIPSHSKQGLAARWPELNGVLSALISEAKWSSVDAVVMGFPGLVNVKQRRVSKTYGKYDDAVDLDLVAWADEQFAAPLYIDNDARLAALGEWKHGAGENMDHLLMITLGTGVGTTAIVDGQMLRGGADRAGILGGHLVVQPDGDLCHCGRKGCLEVEASTASLPQWFDRLNVEGLEKPDPVDFAWVFRESEKGHPTAQALKERCLQMWSRGVANLVQAFDPERVVIGGGVAASGQLILEPLKRELDTLDYAKVPECTLAQLGNHSANYGASVLIGELS